MRNQRQLALSIAAVCLALTISSPSAHAGEWFGLRFGHHGVGLSFGVGSWGVYSRGWSDSHWSYDFNTVLSGHGEWLWVDGLGRVWRPWVTAGWRPYTHGRWVYTSYGWTWVAYEPWGYIPHHYGHWAHAAYGWVWVPGYTYHASRVVWVHAGSYIGYF